MARTLVRAMLRGALKDVRHIQAVPPADAQGLVARVYEQMERDFGVTAPPLVVHSPAPTSLAAGWLLLRETLLVEGEVSRAAKETAAVAVSRANSCSYGADVHQATLDTLPHASVGDGTRLTDWARSSGLHPSLRKGQEPPFSLAEAPEMCGVAVTFHYINRMVSVFLPDSPMPDQAPGFLRGPMLRMVARAMRPVTPGPLTPGASLGLLPAAALPAGFEWAESRPSVADALARAAAALGDAAHWVPESVQQRLHSRFALWNGAPSGPTPGWFAHALVGLSPADQPTARLAMLIAFAPNQVTDADIAAFRERYATDRELVELASWAAFAAAAHIGARLFPGAERVPSVL